MPIKRKTALLVRAICGSLACFMIFGPRMVFADTPPLADETAQEIRVSIREAMNPFNEPTAKFITLALFKAGEALAFKLNDKEVDEEALDALLMKLAAIDANQIIVVEADEDISPEDMEGLLDMLKKYGLRNAVKRGQGSEAIWLIEE